MKKPFENLRETVEYGLRKACGKISPDRRTAVVIALSVVFAALDLWMTGKAIWNIGREDVHRKRVEILHRMEEIKHFGQPLNIENHDTTTLEQTPAEQ